MSGLYIAPSYYYSAYDILDEFGGKVKRYGKKFFILSEKKILELYSKALETMEKENLTYCIGEFNGICCHSEINRISKEIKINNCDAIIGIGGGKILDCVKAAGYKAGVKIITVPSIAATCAAWSSHSAIYDENGVYEEYYNIYKNPDFLFMDKKILAEAPIRYIISGIVDTLAKWVETDAFTNGIKEKSLELDYAIYLAKRSYEELFNYGKKALDDIRNGVYSIELEKTIDHIILTAGLIGGIGGESCRSVAAHAVNNGFTVISDIYNKNLHGEVVGFGNIVQMVLDKKDENEIKKLAKFYKEIGAPMSLKDFGLGDLSKDEIGKVVNKIIDKKETIWNLSYKVDFEMVEQAIYKANEILIKL